MSRLSAFIRRHSRSRSGHPASFPIGPAPEDYPDDALDRLVTVNGREDPDWYEAIMRRIQEDARSDPELATLLRDFNLDRDPAEAFANFVASPVPAAVARLLGLFGYPPTAAIADVGCGRGHLAFALARLGFGDVTAMDPNGNASTGTGYLAGLGGHSIGIVNQLDQWRKIRGRFDAIITMTTIHHWQNITAAAIDARRTLRADGRWFALAEYYANVPSELVQALTMHPFVARYGAFEWAYPASAYVDLIEAAGFRLEAVIPFGYRGNALMRGVPDGTVAAFDAIDADLPGTVDMFWAEVAAIRAGKAPGYFTYPQAMVFRRVTIR